MRLPRMAWADVYGSEWQQGAADLARYFGKQFGCMLATQRLPIPGDLIAFLDGAPRCPSMAFMIYRNWRAGNMHNKMLREGAPDGIMSFVGLLPSKLYESEGRFAGVDYGYHIGYVWFMVDWFDGTDRSSWWEHPVIDIPEVNGDFKSRNEWRLLIAAERLKNLFSNEPEADNESSDGASMFLEDRTH